MRVVATAGHVDHGKSTLVRALTGTDPDRLAEEKARGLTIDLGFAFTELAADVEVGFVDVPGHVRFVKNMLAGVGAVDVAMVVVAANEGWMPQTAEHVAILELLEFRAGCIALTKADLVDDETLQLAQLELAERLDGSALARWPVVAVDGVSGRGLDALRTALAAVLRDAPEPRDDRRPRMWIDRVFAVKGAGTVVTGTLTGGFLHVDQEVVVEPGHRSARIRRIETHNARRDRIGPGNRVALNLSGISHDELRRGDAIVLPRQWATPTVIDIAARVLPGHDLPRRGEVHAHIGSGEFVVRVHTIDADDSHRVRARLEIPVALPLAPGDQLVLRSSARRDTLGGGEVLDVAPVRRIADARDRLRLPLAARVIAARPWSTPRELAPLAGVADGDAWADEAVAAGVADRVGQWLVAPDLLASVRDRTLERLRSPGSDAFGLDLASIAESMGLDAAKLRAAFTDDPRFVVSRELVRDAEQQSIEDDPDARALLAKLSARPFDPPSPAELGASPALVRALVRNGSLVDLDGVFLTRDAYDTARARVADAVVERGTLSVADARDLLGSSRKYVVPLLGRLDAEGVTRRRGDQRIPGARVRDGSAPR
jgi:selenocysteine-specific elongation factor